MKASNWVDRLPMSIRLQRLYATIRAELTFPQSSAPGHFYSPIPSRKEVLQERQRIFRADMPALPEIELREAAQLELLARLGRHTQSLQLARLPGADKRYYLENDYFFRADATVFAGMLAENRPVRYLEIGSGFSSALALDLKDQLFGGRLKCTFIEPDTARLRTLLRAADHGQVVIHESPVQAVPASVFAELEANDILFVDGSHISKVGSDLNDVLFRILPLLQTGVLIHFHDIYWPFEYPEDIVLRGWSWNEAYLLRAFLANNPRYRIEFFPSWVEKIHPAAWRRAFPGGPERPASSLWLRKASPF